jgi:hypothetical protein
VLHNNASPKRERTDAGTRARDGMLIENNTGKERSLWPLLTETRHTLLVFEDMDTPLSLPFIPEDRIRVLVITTQQDPAQKLRKRYNFSGDGWVLIRPDHVIAARGNGMDTALLTKYIQTVLS